MAVIALVSRVTNAAALHRIAQAQPEICQRLMEVVGEENVARIEEQEQLAVAVVAQRYTVTLHLPEADEGRVLK